MGRPGPLERALARAARRPVERLAATVAAESVEKTTDDIVKAILDSIEAP